MSFKNTLIILTSNVGSRAIAGTSTSGLGALVMRQRQAASAAQHAQEVEEEEDPTIKASAVARMKDTVMTEVKAAFKPELINRFDETVVFQRLGRREVRAIASLMLAETRERVAARGYTLVVAQPLVERIVADGASDEYGVRPLRQTIVR